MTSAFPVFTTNTPGPTQTGCSTGFWVAKQFDLHNKSARYTGSFKQFNYAGGWESDQSLYRILSLKSWTSAGLDYGPVPRQQARILTS